MTYTVTISLDNDTLMALQYGQWQMQVYKGCKSPGASAALPTVWYTVPNSEFSSTNTVSWDTPYGGYFSNTTCQAGATVNTSTQEPMQLGSVMTLSTTGSASVSTSGEMPEAFTFLSEKQETWACGMLVNPQGRVPSPICAFPQSGAMANVIKPYEKVLILFTQDRLDVGTIVRVALTHSVSCTLSTSNPNIEVEFSISMGWNTKGNPNARPNPIHFELAPDLIIPGA